MRPVLIRAAHRVALHARRTQILPVVRPPTRPRLDVIQRRVARMLRIHFRANRTEAQLARPSVLLVDRPPERRCHAEPLPRRPVPPLRLLRASDRAIPLTRVSPSEERHTALIAVTPRGRLHRLVKLPPTRTPPCMLDPVRLTARIAPAAMLLIHGISAMLRSRAAGAALLFIRTRRAPTRHRLTTARTRIRRLLPIPLCPVPTRAGTVLRLRPARPATLE